MRSYCIFIIRPRSILMGSGIMLMQVLETEKSSVLQVLTVLKLFG